MKVIGEAFDSAWSEIAHRFDKPSTIEAARFMLANAILSTAHENSRDAAELKDAALRRLAFNDSSRSRRQARRVKEAC